MHGIAAGMPESDQAALGHLVQVLARQQANLEVLLSCTPQGIALFGPDGTLSICNRRYMAIYGLREELAVPGTSHDRIVQLRAEAGVYPDDRADEAIERSRRIISRERVTSEIFTLKDGKRISVTCHPLEDGGWLSTHDDITELWTLQREIEHMAYHDPLTGLANCRLLRERLAATIENARQGYLAALMIIDLDGFKSVNDEHGHPAGDALLEQVAERIRDCVGGTDLVARIGGDEFAVVHEADHTRNPRLVSEKIVKAVARPYLISHRPVRIGASVGLVLIESRTSSVDELMRRADKAMYASKRSGKGRVTLDEEMAA